MKRCPECGSGDVRSQNYELYDYGTGYHDFGTRGICNQCGLDADIEDFAPSERARLDAARTSELEGRPGCNDY
jgi:hypothetical protein